MKKLLSLLVAAMMICSCLMLTSCGTKETAETKTTEDSGNKAPDVKLGFICLHDENSTYDKNFIDAAKAAQKELGLKDEQVLIKTNIPESAECYEAAASLVDAGCNVIFADSFGHEDYIIQAAKEFPEVIFAHATGTKAHTENLPNYFNAFASIYEGRYIAGVAAGLKLQEMIDEGKITADKAKMGYVGAYPYAEVKSGYTSFYLGARSIVPEVTMEVKFTNSWFDIAAEKETANALIADGCVLISQHADSEGAPKACEEAGVPNVAYNLDTREWGPNSALISSKINWTPYLVELLTCKQEGKTVVQDFCKGIADGSVELIGLNDKVAAKGTEEKLNEVEAKIKSGEIKVFDTKTFTVKGQEITSYMADVDSDADFTPDTEVVSDGYFHESEKRSAPYFDLDIDGITIK